jgi:hypothetical protein
MRWWVFAFFVREPRPMIRLLKREFEHFPNPYFFALEKMAGQGGTLNKNLVELPEIIGTKSMVGGLRGEAP